MLTLWTALAVLGACAAARWFLNRTSRRESSCAGGWIRLCTLWNPGAAFGFKVGLRALIVFSGVLLCAVWRRRKMAPVSAGLILGGGISNLYERLRYGRVYDYLRFPKTPGFWKDYVYNLADLAIFAGAVRLMLKKKR